MEDRLVKDLQKDVGGGGGGGGGGDDGGVGSLTLTQLAERLQEKVNALTEL